MGDDGPIGAREFGRLEAQVEALAGKIEEIDSGLGGLDDKVSQILVKLSAEEGAKKARWGLVSGVTAIASSVSAGVAWVAQHLSHGPKP